MLLNLRWYVKLYHLPPSSLCYYFHLFFFLPRHPRPLPLLLLALSTPPSAACRLAGHPIRRLRPPAGRGPGPPGRLHRHRHPGGRRRRAGGGGCHDHGHHLCVDLGAGRGATLDPARTHLLGRLCPIRPAPGRHRARPQGPDRRAGDDGHGHARDLVDRRAVGGACGCESRGMKTRQAPRRGPARQRPAAREAIFSFSLICKQNEVVSPLLFRAHPTHAHSARRERERVGVREGDVKVVQVSLIFFCSLLVA